MDPTDHDHADGEPTHCQRQRRADQPGSVCGESLPCRHHQPDEFSALCERLDGFRFDRSDTYFWRAGR